MLLQQQPIYQTQQEVFQARQQLHQQTAQVQPVITSAGVIMASQGAPMSPRSQRAGAYVHVQGQTAQVATPPPQTTQGSQSSAKIPQRPQSAHGYPPGGSTSRAPTPVQGPVTSSPRRGAQPSTMALTHPHLRTDSGMMYGSQRSLQSVGLVVEGRGGREQQPPRPMSTSPPPYNDHHNLIDSDIYGRIGMTRHVQASVGVGPRSLPTTPVSPPDSSQSSFVAVNPAAQNVMSEDTELNACDLSRGRRYMSREELYAAMRHPQYYNYHRGTMAGPTGDFTSQNNTPSSSRSTSPAVFGVSPLPSYTVRPQAQTTYGAWPPDQQVPQQQSGASHRESPSLYQTQPSAQDDDSPTEVEPPLPYQNLSDESSMKYEPSKPSQFSGGKSASAHQNQQMQVTQAQQNQQSQPLSSTPKQTTRVDFKKMILNQSMSSAGGNQRISAVEMLKASRPGIYGYSPPPAPVVKPPQPTPAPVRSEGVIMPPSSRNTARALLFQSRFGSGRSVGSPERRNVQSVRGPLTRAYSEPCSSQAAAASYSPSSSPVENVEEVAHSTPNTTLDQPPQPPDVSMITSDTTQEGEQSTAQNNNNTEEKESMETAL
ncbi:hypothetical protein C7M84_004484 [Penaeus vannamei]|uniref:Uncharacterized protein n=1 Tax=Penaeus vannamei TaxID=6689 RepID=A0A3R7QF68_PENVA|nr:hypothetical protein C7M84_004484 [Penaeus vannamei]